MVKKIYLSKEELKEFDKSLIKLTNDFKKEYGMSFLDYMITHPKETEDAFRVAQIFPLETVIGGVVDGSTKYENKKNS